MRWVWVVGGSCVLALAGAATGSALGLNPLLATGLVAIPLIGAVLAAMRAVAEHDDLEIRERAASTRARFLEDQVRRHRDALDELADGLDVLIFLCDSKGTVLYANLAAENAFRFEQPEGKSILSVTMSPELEQLVEDAARTHTPQRAELTLTHPERRVGMAQAWAEAPSFERVFLGIYDITSLRRLERVRRDFVANVSHELRTPMTNIRALAETLLEDGEENPKLLPKYLDRIMREIDRLTAITRDLLILSQVEAVEAKKSPIDLVEVVRHVLTQMSVQATDKGLALNYEGPERLALVANEGHMTQLLTNLVANAINYTQEGSVTVRLGHEDGLARVDVIDTGIGLSSEHLPRIFERFYRVDKSRSRSTGGTGLGLAIVRNIAEQHGGSVAVESALKQGSVFTVRLPVG